MDHPGVLEEELGYVECTVYSNTTLPLLHTAQVLAHNLIG